MDKEPKGAKKKEAIRQQKRKIKAEVRAAGEEARRKKWEKERGIVSDKPQDKDTRFKKQDSKSKPRRSDDNRSVTPSRFDDRKQAEQTKGSLEHKKRETEFKPQRSDDNRQAKPSKFEGHKQAEHKDSFKYKKEDSRFRPQHSDDNKSEKKTKFESKSPRQRTPTPWDKEFDSTQDKKSDSSSMPLNKYIAHAGVCARREAAELVKLGIVTVNGDKVFEPGYKVSTEDEVKVKGKKVFLQHNLVYILLNKPKDYITTANDPEGRKTVFELVKDATKERIFPVGRLDRNTTGVLLLTNDGELTQKLTHPSYEIKKIYEVRLDKPLTKKDFDAILSGITLEDGFVIADSLAYADSKDKSIIGIEIHSGRNRIVRRIFEHLGYDVKNLDRVMFANLTKKNVDRGKWRFLNEKEVRLLKFMNQSFLKKKAQAKN